MKKFLLSALVVGFSMSATTTTMASSINDPEMDRELMVQFFLNKNPKIKFENYRMGAYNYSDDKMSQYESVMEFPPYLDHIDAGEELYNKDLAVYEKCFGDDVSKIRPKYPYFSEKSQQVVTLEGDINKCRKDAGLKPYKWKKGDIAKVSAYIASQANGEKVNVKIESEGAKKAFYAGQKLYVEPRGQFGLSCAKCHTYNAGRKARANLLSPNLGHTTGFPVYRAKWQDLGTLHRRFGGCHKNMRVKPFKAQSEEYRNLEFFEAYMSNGLEIDGPAYRE